MKWRMTVWLLILTMLLSSFLPGQASADPAQAVHKKAVLVLVDGLRLADLSPKSTPNLWRLHEIGAIGVMNHNVLGTKTDGSAALTLGAGTRASYPMQGVAAYGTHEQVKEGDRAVTGGDLYVRHMGTAAPAGAAIVVPQLPQIQEANTSTRYTIVPGMLGDAVHDLGGSTALLGNSDLGSEAYRPAALIAMDHNGIIDAGDLQAGLRTDPTRPYGMRTDLKAMYETYQKVSQHAQLLVLETGDLLRWEKARDVMTREYAERSYRQALGEADQLIGLLLPEAGPTTMLAVLSPTKHPGADEAAVSPVLIAGGDMSGGSLLTSSTTKRSGLLANYDIAPTIVQFLGGDPGKYSFLGQPVSAQSGTKPDSYQEVTEQVQKMMITNAARPLLLKPWLNAWIGLALAVLIAQLFRRSWLRVLRPVSEAMMIVPLTWLFVPIYSPSSALQVLVFTLCITMTLWLFFQGFRNPVTRLGIVAAVTVATLVVDLLLGAPLEKQSILSYDPIAGARYYGIGNEYMGILLGSVLLLLNVWFSRRPQSGAKSRLSAALLCGLVTYLFAAPSFGTNAGGALAAAIGFTYGYLQIANLKMTARRWMGLAFVAMGIGFVMFGMNVLMPGGQQTHIGRAASQLLIGQFGEVVQIAVRKVELNFLLLRVSAWGKLLVLLLALFVLWTIRNKTTAPGFLSRNGKTLLVTSLAALALNDSGVVSAALTLLYAVVPMIGSDEAQETALPAGADETPTHTH